MDERERDELQLLQRPVTRRGALALLGGLGLVAAGCSGGSDGSDATATTRGSRPSSPSSPSSPSREMRADCAPIPEETGGPFPSDGSNGPDALGEQGVVRKDITSSFDGMSGSADGVPYTMQFTIVDVDAGCEPLAGAAIYAWHCDREGRYSMYESAADANFLRGVQGADGNGVASFTSIFPGCYPGRWPHVHFTVYPSVEDATNATNPLVTSQLAFPKDVCEAAYEASGYEQSVGNLAGISLSSDTVFRDGVSLQTPSMTGNVSNGYVSSLVVGVPGSV